MALGSLGFPIPKDKAEEEAREVETKESTGWGGKNKRSTEATVTVVAAPKKVMGIIGEKSWYLVSG